MSGRPLTTASPGTSYRRQGHIYGDPTNASVKGGYGDLSDLTSPLPAMPRGPPRTPSPNTPYRWQDYINVDWTNDPVSQAIRAAIAATPHGDLNDLPSSDSGTENGMITPRSISPDRRINARPPMRIDPVPTASSGLSHQSTHSTSQETHQTTRPNQRQSRNPATRQYRRPLTRSRHTSRLVSLSYDSPKSLNGYRGGREVQITSDELLQQMVGLAFSPRHVAC